MKIVITESQKEKILRNLIKKNGIEFASNIFGGIENIFSTFNIETPMDFLHLFDDLGQVQSEKYDDLILFRYKPEHDFMIYNTEYNIVYIDYYEMWLILGTYFGLNYDEIQTLTEEWLGEVYNLRGVTTHRAQLNKPRRWVSLAI